MSTGDGLVPPLNAPPAPLVTAGAQPGVSSPVVLAQYVIVLGPSGGLFIYSGTPGSGNYPIIWATGAASDPYGNALPASGIGTASGGTSGDPYVMMSESHLLFGLLGGSETDDSAIYANDMGSLSIYSGLQSATDTDAVIFLQSEEYNAGILPVVTVGNAALVSTAGTTAYPSLISTDSWHTFVLDSGWSVSSGHAAPAYKLLPDGSMATTGSATHASFTSATALNSLNELPSVYRPANYQYIPGDSNTAGCEFTPAGEIVAEPMGSGSTTLCLDGKIFWPGQ